MANALNKTLEVMNTVNSEQFLGIDKVGYYEQENLVSKNYIDFKHYWSLNWKLVVFFINFASMTFAYCDNYQHVCDIQNIWNG